ncbi:MAG: LAGLIDADG family homing endonuclease, partial [Halobacteriales archaeon]
MTEAEFESFFRRYYRERILELARGYPEESRSLTIRWDDLYQYDPDLADALRAHPERTLAEARDALASFDVPVDVDLEGAAVHVSGYPRTTPIRELRSAHANRLVAVRGIVRKATPVRPKVEVAVYECLTCGGRTELVQRGHELREPNRCPHCERNSPFDRLDDQSRFVDAQRLRIQESPEGLRGGETPQNIDVHLEEDLTGVVSPGDRVTAVGVLKLREQESGGRTSPILDVYLEGNHLELEEEEFEVMEVDDADVEAIEALAASDDIYERVVDSIAPSIWGYEEEKLAMALQLFSGVRKNLPDGSRVRGDIHVLLVGDPGTGKSQLLQYISKIAPRSVYTSGKGSSAAGLCVTGDTMIHTTEGFRRIEDIVAEDLPDAVQTDTPAEAGHEVYTYDRVAGSIRPRETSRVWRMPEKPCRRIETAAGKTLEASVNTPVLTLGEDGLAWRRVADIDAGDPVAVPKYFGVDRRTPGVHEYLEFTTEKLKLTDDAVSFIRHRLVDTYGSLRDAAAALGLTEDDLYSMLPNRHVPLEKLDRILDAIGLDRDDVAIDRAMVRHGSSMRIPAAFDADLMYLIGLVFGDGEVRVSPRGGNRGYVRLSNGDESILERAAAIIEDKFDVGVDIERQPARVPSIRLHSVTVARWFRNLGIESPKVDIALDHRLTTAEHTDAFLRGLFDADGAVCERDDGGSSVQLSTISPKFGRQLQLMLETYGVRARLRERDPSPPATRDDGLVIEGNYSRHELLIYGADIDRFADRIEFDARAKRAALDRIAGAVERRGETLPIGETLAKADGGTAGGFHNTLVRGNDPTLETARRLLREADLGDLESAVREVVTDGIAWDEVVAAEDIGDREVFDLTVPTSHNFAGNGLITHNTAAAVRDDFGDGSQWSLEAGALVLADQGIAAVDELDKMRSEDRSAMHEALE